MIELARSSLLLLALFVFIGGIIGFVKKGRAKRRLLLEQSAL